MGNFTAALHKLTPSRLLAVLFLLFIGYVACAPFPQFLSNTKALFTEGISPRNYIRSIDDQYSGMLSTEKEKPLLQNKGTYINLNGLMARFLKQPSMNNCIRLRNGHLATPNTDFLQKDTLQSISDGIASLYQAQASQGKHFLFVLAPSQIDPNQDLLPVGYTDDANEAADYLINCLETSGIPCLDLRERMAQAGMDYSEAFFRTDHHWTPQTGFWAYTVILEKLEEIGAVSPINPYYTDAGSFDFVIQKSCLLGSAGKRTGMYYAGLDDFCIIKPQFDTYISTFREDIDLLLEGRYEEVCNQVFPESFYTDPDYYNTTAYDLYGWSDTNPIQRRNDSAPEKKQFLLIGDSFGNVPFSLLSLYVSKCDELDMRLFSGSFASYYETCGPDTVILLINVNGILDTNASYPYFSEKTGSVN